MISLAVTTSTDHGGLAVFNGNKLLAEKSWTRKSGQSEIVTHYLALLLKKLKMKPSDLDCVLLDIGPGSFTGCRISANLAKTLAHGLAIPVYIATSLDILLWQNKKKRKIWAIVDAHKSLFYTKNTEQKHSSIELLDEVTLLARMATKDGLVGVFPSALGKKFKNSRADWPRARTLGRMLAEKSSALSKSDWRHVEPLYIRVPDAVQKAL